MIAKGNSRNSGSNHMVYSRLKEPNTVSHYTSKYIQKFNKPFPLFASSTYDKLSFTEPISEFTNYTTNLNSSRQFFINYSNYFTSLYQGFRDVKDGRFMPDDERTKYIRLKKQILLIAFELLSKHVIVLYL